MVTTSNNPTPALGTGHKHLCAMWQTYVASAALQWQQCVLTALFTAEGEDMLDIPHSSRSSCCHVSPGQLPLAGWLAGYLSHMLLAPLPVCSCDVLITCSDRVLVQCWAEDETSQVNFIFTVWCLIVSVKVGLFRSLWSKTTYWVTNLSLIRTPIICLLIVLCHKKFYWKLSGFIHNPSQQCKNGLYLLYFQRNTTQLNDNQSF